MTTTKQYTVSELGLMLLEDLMRHIAAKYTWFDETGELVHDIAIGGSLEIPVKAYAVSVLERFVTLLTNRMSRTWDFIEYNPAYKKISFIREQGYEYELFHCPTNPFDGLVNDDGTPVTSVTRETLEAWKREVSNV